VSHGEALRHGVAAQLETSIPTRQRPVKGKVFHYILIYLCTQYSSLRVMILLSVGGTAANKKTEWKRTRKGNGHHGWGRGKRPCRYRCCKKTKRNKGLPNRKLYIYMCMKERKKERKKERRKEERKKEGKKESVRVEIVNGGDHEYMDLR